MEVAATLVLLPWAWGEFHRVHGELAAYQATKVVAHAAAAVLLLIAGRRDLRTWLLGVYCLLKATLPPLHMLPAFFLEIAPPEQFSAFVQALPAVEPALPLPVCALVPVRAGVPVGVRAGVPSGPPASAAR